MFRTNDDHNQISLLDVDQLMSERSRKRLENSWAVPFYKNVFTKIDETCFEALFSKYGAPNFPVNILVSLELFKYMFNWSDDQLMEEYDFNYLVNYAVGNRQLGQMPLAEKTLYNFRTRCYQYLLSNPNDEHPVFAQFLSLLTEYAKTAGVKMSEQRLDTTMFMSNIKKAGRLSLCFDVLELAVKSIPEDKRPPELQQVMEPSFRKDQLYHSKASEAESRLTVLLNLSLVARDLLMQEKGYQELDAYKRICRIIKEQAVENDDGTLVPRLNKEISSSSLQSAYDDDSTFREKNGVKQSGYVASISETCDKENPIQLITDIEVEPSITSDVSLLRERRSHIVNTGAKDLYIDGGFHSAKPDEQEDGLNLHFTNMSGTRPSKKLDITQFEFNDACHIVKCPGGFIPKTTGIASGQTIAHFERSACENCPLKSQCHTKIQKKSAVVRISLKSLRAVFIRKDTELNIIKYTSKRAGIEGTNSAMKRCGMAKMKVRNKNRCKLTAIYMALSQNTKRVLKFLTGKVKPKQLLPTGSYA